MKLGLASVMASAVGLLAGCSSPSTQSHESSRVASTLSQATIGTPFGAFQSGSFKTEPDKASPDEPSAAARASRVG
jgi:hypothetical protein